MKKLHNILLDILYKNPEIINKYNIYNNRFITAEQKEPLGLNIVIINPVLQNINRNDIFNSEVYNYFAVFVKHDIYIINREKLIEDIQNGMIPYSFKNTVYLSDDYLIKHNTRILKY